MESIENINSNKFFQWRQEGHKYGYSTNEAFMMVLVTALTNFSCFPSLILLYKKGLHFQFYVGIFTFVTSFMYHFVESIGAERIWMTESEWHQLDNIGAIMCFIILVVYMGNLKNFELEMHLNYSALFIVIMLQLADPWNLWCTILPIILYGLIVIYFSRKYNSVTFSNREMTIKGVALIFIGAIFFSLSQNEFNDYLRIYHGLWHSVVGYSAMYTWQTSEKKEDQIAVSELFTKQARRQNARYDTYKQI